MLSKAQLFYFILSGSLICAGQVLILKGSASERSPIVDFNVPEEFSLGCPMTGRDNSGREKISISIQDNQNGPQGEVAIKFICKYNTEGRLSRAEEYNHLRGYGRERPTRWTVFNYGLEWRAMRADLFDMTHSEGQAKKVLLLY